MYEEKTFFWKRQTVKLYQKPCSSIFWLYNNTQINIYMVPILPQVGDGSTNQAWEDKHIQEMEKM